MTIENRHTIINEKGLHARASAKLVETVERFNANAIISKDDISVSKSTTSDSVAVCFFKLGLLLFVNIFATIRNPKVTIIIINFFIYLFCLFL